MMSVLRASSIWGISLKVRVYGDQSGYVQTELARIATFRMVLAGMQWVRRS